MPSEEHESNKSPKFWRENVKTDGNGIINAALRTCVNGSVKRARGLLHYDTAEALGDDEVGFCFRSKY